MATHVSCLIRFSDGSFTFLRDTIASAATLSEIQTDASGLLNITADLSCGVANQGKTATHALGKVQTDSVTTGAWNYGAFYDPQGTVLCPIQGGGSAVTGLPALSKPVRMQSGVTVKVSYQAVADAVKMASIAAVCASGKCDIFTATAVDDADVSMQNASGATWGEALAGQTVVQAYASYPATNGLADTGIVDGVDALFIESASGQLLGMYAPELGNQSTPSAWIRQAIRVSQNDTATCRANV